MDNILGQASIKYLQHKYIKNFNGIAKIKRLNTLKTSLRC